MVMSPTMGMNNVAQSSRPLKWRMGRRRDRNNKERDVEASVEAASEEMSMGSVATFFSAFFAVSLLAVAHAAKSPSLVVRSADQAAPSSTSQSSSTSSCAQFEAETQGPYWIEESFVNSYMAQNLSYGLPLNITFRVVNATLSADLDNDCVPIQGARIDIWHARYDGLYSDVQEDHTLNETWLRGAARTNSTGHASFYTIYPGWYTSRTVHIHLRVRTYDLDFDVSYEQTTQLYFDDDVTDGVFANVYPYNERTQRDTNNTNDDLFTSSNLMSLVGDYYDGYFADVEFAVPFSSPGHVSHRYLTNIADDD